MSKAKGCFKFGCIGCLVIVAGFLALGIGAVVINVTSESRIESREVARELPVGTAPPGFLGADSPSAAEELPLSEGAPQPPASFPGGTVDLDLRVGEFEIEPVAAGEPIRIAGEYDVEAFVLEEELVEEGDSWTYAITFKPRGGLFGLAARSHHQSPANLVLQLPVDRPIALTGEIGIGQTEAELGGLWLTRVDLTLGTGEHNFSFSDPTREPVELLRLEKSIGAMRIRGVGEASPAAAFVSQRLGELDLDLEGGWRTDSEIEVRFGIGECDIDVPSDVRVELGRVNLALGERQVRLPREDELPEGAPTLTISARSRIGELQIR